MRTARLRVRSVTMKATGASYRVLRNERGARVADLFAEHCHAIRHQRADDMAGFAVVAWGFDHALSTSVVVGDGRSLPKHSVPDYVRTAVLDHVITMADPEPPKPDSA